MNDYAHLFVCLMGMGTVFIGLICIVLLCYLMSTVVRSVSKPAAAVSTAPVPSSPVDSGALVAAVSAAIAEEMGTDISAIRIVSIRKV